MPFDLCQLQGVAAEKAEEKLNVEKGEEWKNNDGRE